MRLIPKMAKLICDNCKENFLLPKNGTIKKAGDSKCPLDNF